MRRNMFISGICLMLIAIYLIPSLGFEPLFMILNVDGPSLCHDSFDFRHACIYLMHAVVGFYNIFIIFGLALIILGAIKNPMDRKSDSPPEMRKRTFASGICLVILGAYIMPGIATHYYYDVQNEWQHDEYGKLVMLGMIPILVGMALTILGAIKNPMDRKSDSPPNIRKGMFISGICLVIIGSYILPNSYITPNISIYESMLPIPIFGLALIILGAIKNPMDRKSDSPPEMRKRTFASGICLVILGDYIMPKVVPVPGEHYYLFIVFGMVPTVMFGLVLTIIGALKKPKDEKVASY